MLKQNFKEGEMNTDERKELVPFCFGERIVRAFADDSGNPWFVAKDVCNILELENVTKALYGLDDDEVADLTISEVSSNRVKQNRNVNTISESGLYALVFRSRKPEAKAFSKWVRSEVLPAIRKTGRYEKHAGKAAKVELPPEMPTEALALKPAMRQKLMRDAIRLASLDSGGIDQAVLWFGRLCRTVAATPPAPPLGPGKGAGLLLPVLPADSRRQNALCHPLRGFPPLA